MENNSQNSGNQINQNNIVQKNNNSKILIMLLVLIIVCLAGYIVYTKFIQKDENPTPKPNNTQEQDNNQQNTNNNGSENVKLEGLTFKTSDDKQVLEIVSKNDSSVADKAKKYNSEALESVDYDYYGYYNNDLYVLTYVKSDDDIDNSKYIVLGGINLQKEIGGQCVYSHEFIINKDNKTLVNFSYYMKRAEEDGGYYYGNYYQIKKVQNKYYFAEGGCALGFLPGILYDEKLNKIGDYFINNDNNGNIYVLNDGLIVKYNKDGNIIKKSTQKYELSYINHDSIVYSDTLYVIAYINEKYYLLDSMNEDKYQWDNVSDYFASPGADSYPSMFRLEDNIIKLYGMKYDNDTNKEKEVLLYTFDPTTKTLAKK